MVLCSQKHCLANDTEYKSVWDTKCQACFDIIHVYMVDDITCVGTFEIKVISYAIINCQYIKFGIGPCGPFVSVLTLQRSLTCIWSESHLQCIVIKYNGIYIQ